MARSCFPRHSLLIAVVLVAWAWNADAFSSQLVYSDGGTPGVEYNGFAIYPVYMVSDSFSVSSSASLVSAQVGLFVASGSGVPSSLDWAIGTTLGGSDVSSGAALLSNTAYPNQYYQSTFPISGQLLPNETYYLTLSDGLTTDGGPPYDELAWDDVAGPSVEMANDTGGWYSSGGLPNGNEFSLYAVPEPSAITLLASAFIALWAAAGVPRLRFRRRRI
jgi:hypothetical protein